MHLNLEWLVEADVDKLAETCAATRNMDNFNAHFLDGLHNSNEETLMDAAALFNDKPSLSITERTAEMRPSFFHAV